MNWLQTVERVSFCLLLAAVPVLAMLINWWTEE